MSWSSFWFSLSSLRYSLGVECPAVVTRRRPRPDHLLTCAPEAAVTEEIDQKSEIYRFGRCELDADRRELTINGEPVTTQPKAFELLLYLVRNRSRAVVPVRGH